MDIFVTYPNGGTYLATIPKFLTDYIPNRDGRKPFKVLCHSNQLTNELRGMAIILGADLEITHDPLSNYDVRVGERLPS